MNINITLLRVFYHKTLKKDILGNKSSFKCLKRTHKVSNLWNSFTRLKCKMAYDVERKKSTAVK